MTRFLDVKTTASLVQSIGIETVLTEMAAYVADDYRHWAEFEKYPRVVNHSKLGVNELMPAANRTLYGFKYVNGHPANTAKGLMTVVAFGMLATVETGYPVLLCEMTLTTALRTGATSAVAARALARKDSSTMAVIGCGSQSEFQILAFKALLGIKDVRVYDVDPQAMDKLRHNLSAYDDLKITAAGSVREAVKGVDIVTTVTADKTRATILTPDMIEPGMHLNAIGGDCPGKTELHADIVRAGRVFVEFAPQTRIEGEIQQMPADFPVVELWEVLTDTTQGRQSAAQVTIFDSVGFALEDFSGLRYFNDKAVERNAGSFIDLIPSLANPKDLYSLLQTVSLPVPPAFKMTAKAERR